MLERVWGVSGRLGDLPDAPQWLINTTCIDTGKNWRFSKREMGDWTFGRHYAPDVPVAVAAAASAAVPYVVGAMSLPLPATGWWETDPSTGRQTRTTTPSKSWVRLWDGGAYDNMGLEALSKPGRALRSCDFLICSDASGPLRPPGSSPFAALFRGSLSSPRLFDVAGDQIRALRSRMLIADIAAGTVDGVLLRMGNSVRAVDVKSGTSNQRPSTTSSRATSRPKWRCGIRPTSRRRWKPSSTCSLARFRDRRRHADDVRAGPFSAIIVVGRPHVKSIRTLPRLSSRLFRLVVLLLRGRTLHDDRRPAH
jgi:hypothetical protein